MQVCQVFSSFLQNECVSDFAAAYALSRTRFEQEVQPLSHAALTYKPSPDSLSIAQMAVHLAGVETWFAAQIFGEALEGEQARLARAAVEGVVDNAPFPYSDAELTPEFVAQSLRAGRDAVERLYAADSPEIRQRELKSALGPMIDGEGAMARCCFHPAYHHGQAYHYTTLPDFPKE